MLAELPSALGLHNIPILVLGVVHLVQRRSRSDLRVLLWTAAVFVPLFVTLPAPRYFMPAFPALAILMACALRRLPGATERAVPLALFYWGEALYLYLVLDQDARLFRG
jgi:hypothetical protein